LILAGSVSCRAFFVLAPFNTLWRPIRLFHFQKGGVPPQNTTLPASFNRKSGKGLMRGNGCAETSGPCLAGKRSRFPARNPHTQLCRVGINTHPQRFSAPSARLVRRNRQFGFLFGFLNNGGKKWTI